MITIEKTKQQGIDIITLTNGQIKVVVTNYGCTIMQLYCLDNKGQYDDVVLGYEHVEEYFDRDAYLGALVGRVANRIGQGRFTLHDTTYTLYVNNGPNHLHGGKKGFSYQVFDYEIIDDTSIRFQYVSKDKEEGYPGDLTLQVLYVIENTSLRITYQATTDMDTIINITNHSYFNLSGKKESIHNHYLQIQANTFACIDSDGLPTGEIKEVTKTPFDFRKEKRIGDALQEEHPQLQLGNGLDHPFIFSTTTNQVSLIDKKSGRRLVVSTTLPGAQIYTANFLDGRVGKRGQKYHARDAVCIETQYLPNEINMCEEGQTILRKDERYEETTTYRFEVLSDEASE